MDKKELKALKVELKALKEEKQWFPSDFKWGVATSAYQIEGATKEAGRGESIWDVFARTPGKVWNAHTGDVACDSFHRVEEDLQLLQELGVQMYRFSIAWPRIVPDGDGEVNMQGFEYYDRLVNGLIARGIEPVCTLYHWDLPQALQARGGWETRDVAMAFANYARLVFEHFRGRIRYWLTINEPWCVSFLSHAYGVHAPGKKDWQTAITVAHHVLYAHGLAVRTFRALGIEGQIGFAPNTEWFEAGSSDEVDVQAARRRNAYINDWFLEPVFKGRYPQELQDFYRAKGYEVPILPGDLEVISERVDWLGVNYYTGGIVCDWTKFSELEGKDIHDVNQLLEWVELKTDWDKTDFGWNIYPQGFAKVLEDTSQKYGPIPIYITENGACYEVEDRQSIMHDPLRIRYIEQHLGALVEAMRQGVLVKGYMCWSLMDNFEWAMGYSKRFGLVHVDFETLKRTPKESFWWYRDWISHQRWLAIT